MPLSNIDDQVVSTPVNIDDQVVSGPSKSMDELRNRAGIGKSYTDFDKTARNIPQTAVADLIGAPVDLANLAIRMTSRAYGRAVSAFGGDSRDFDTPYQIPVGGAQSIQSGVASLKGAPQNELFGAADPNSAAQQFTSGAGQAALTGGRAGLMAYGAQAGTAALGGGEDAQAVAASVGPTAAEVPRAAVHGVLNKTFTDANTLDKIRQAQELTGGASPGTLGQVGSPFATTVQNALAKLPGSGSRIYDSVNQFYASMRDRFNGIIDNISDVKGPAVAGNDIRKGITADDQQQKDLAKQIYSEAADKVPPGTEVSLNPILDAADKASTAVRGNPDLNKDMQTSTQRWIDAKKGSVMNAAIDYGIKQAEAGAQPGITLYHGSTRDFDQFDSSQAGTGHGSSSFGKGAYLGDDPSVAQHYIDNQGGNGTVYTATLPKSKSDTFADWSKPVADQDLPQPVKDKFMEAAEAEAARQRRLGNDNATASDVTFGQVYGNVRRDMGGADALNDFMTQNGVHGHSYGAFEGKPGSRNYVVYDPSQLTITAKNGTPTGNAGKPLFTPITDAMLQPTQVVNPDARLVQRTPDGSEVYNFNGQIMVRTPGMPPPKGLMIEHPPAVSADAVVTLPDGRNVLKSEAQPVLSAIQKNPVLPYTQARDVHTAIGDQLSDPSLVSQGLDAGAIKRLWGGSKQGLNDAIGGTPAGNLHSLADSLYEQQSERRDLLNPVLDGAKTGGPESIFQAAQQSARDTGSGTRFRELFSAAGEQGRPTMVATLLDHMGKFDSDTTTRTQDAMWSPMQFVRNWGTLNSDAKTAISSQLGPQYTSAMDQLDAFVAQQVKAKAITGNPSGTAQATAAITTVKSAGVGILTFLGGLATGHPLSGAAGLAGVGLSLGAANAAARAMTNPHFVQWVANGLKAPPSALPAMIMQLAAVGQQTGDKDIQMLAQVMGQQAGQNGNTNGSQQPPNPPR